jgi:hypothetical protein
LFTFNLSSIHATCSAYLILFDFITRTILCQEYRSLSSSLCSFLHSLITKRKKTTNATLHIIKKITIEILY